MKKEYNNMSLYELLNSNGNKLYKGASEQLINGFERIFNVELPIEYRELLKYTNGAGLFDGDITLYSLFDESISVKHCNLLGNANSPIAKKSIPNELFVIGIYNFGDLICINLNNGNVVQWSHDDDEIFIEYPNIREWLISSAEEMDLV